MEKKLLDLCKKFNIKGNFDSIEIVSNGHINSTFLIRFNENGKLKEYILQMINGHVFKNQSAVMSNIMNVTEHILSNLKSKKQPTDRKTLVFKNTSAGIPYEIDESGDFWRVSEFVENSITFNTTNSPKVLEETGKAFGEFQEYLSDFDAESLETIIPDFHNTQNRYKIFKETVALDPKKRASSVFDEIQEYLSLEFLATQMCNMLANGELKLRVTHNDTKCNNVLFDKDTKEHLCVIDLDTVMPGLLGFDFGDAIRFAGNSASEDEQNLSKVELDLNKYKAFTKGFLSSIKSNISDAEKDTLALGAITMTIECGLRFLTDYIDGDNYFKTDYPTHNLDRARCQLKLAKDMIKKYDKMKAIVDEFYYTPQNQVQ